MRMPRYIGALEVMLLISACSTAYYSSQQQRVAMRSRVGVIPFANNTQKPQAGQSAAGSRTNSSHTSLGNVGQQLIATLLHKLSVQS